MVELHETGPTKNKIKYYGYYRLHPYYLHDTPANSYLVTKYMGLETTFS